MFLKPKNKQNHIVVNAISPKIENIYTWFYKLRFQNFAYSSCFGNVR